MTLKHLEFFAISPVSQRSTISSAYNYIDMATPAKHAPKAPKLYY